MLEADESDGAPPHVASWASDVAEYSQDVKLTVLSYVDQLRHGGSDVVRSHAALALGSLRHFLPKSISAAKAALELGVWDALQEALLEAPSDGPKLLAAVITALSRLIFNPDEPQHVAWPYLRKAAGGLLQEPVLTVLATQLRESYVDSPVPVSVARLVTGLCPFVVPKHEIHLLDSGLVEALLGVVRTGSLSDASHCAIAALALARTTPGMFCALCAPAQLSLEDLQVLDELRPAWRRSTNGQSAEPTMPASTTDLYGSLCELYQHAILPDSMVVRQCDRSSEVTPGVVASLLARALGQEPWLRHQEDITKSTAQKMILKAMMNSNTLGCLLSYLVVDSGSLKHVLGGLCDRVAEVLGHAHAAGADEVDQGLQGLRVLRDELSLVKQKLREARDTGRLEEPWALVLADRAREVAQSGRELQAAVQSVQSQLSTISHTSNKLQSWTTAHRKNTAKVRRCTPQVQTMQGVVSTLSHLITPKQAAEEADKKVDLQLTHLRHVAQGAMLVAGLVPSTIKLHQAAQATLDWCSSLWCLTHDLGVPACLIGRCKELLATVQICRLAVDRLSLRLRISRRQAGDKAKSIRRRLKTHPPQGAQLQQVLEEVDALSWQLVVLEQCNTEVQAMQKDMQRYDTLALTALQRLEGAVHEAHSLGVSRQDPGKPQQSGSQQAGGQATPGPVLNAMLNSVLPLVADGIGNLLQERPSPLPAPMEQQGEAQTKPLKTHRRKQLVATISSQEGAWTPALPGIHDDDLVALAQTEAQLQNLSTAIQAAEAQPELQHLCQAARRRAWNVFHGRLKDAHVHAMLPGSLQPTLPPAIDDALQPLSHPEYHLVHELSSQPDRCAAAMPRLYLTQLMIELHWRVMDMSGSHITTGADPVNTPGLTLGGQSPGQLQPSHAGPQRPSAAPASGINSNYKSIVFTMSPCKGCPPRNLDKPMGLPTVTIPGLRDEDLDRLSLPDQCETVLTTTLDALSLACRLVPNPTENPDTHEEDGDTEDQEPMQDPLLAGDGWEPGIVQRWHGQRGRQYQAVESLTQQVNQAAAALGGLTQLAQCMRSLRRQACLLTSSISASWVSVKPDQQRRWMAPLMRMLAHGLRKAADRGKILCTIQDAAEQCCTYPEDYHSVYVETGLVPAVARLLAGPHGGTAAKEGGTAHVSRYGVDPSVVARPSAAASEVQAAACAALVAIAQLHPQALLSVVPYLDGGSSDLDGNAMSRLKGVIFMTTDHSLPRATRLQGAMLLAALVTMSDRGDPEQGSHPAALAALVAAREEAIKSGAFGALLDVLDSDHRQPDPHGAKDATIDALVTIALSDSLRDAVVAASEAAGDSGVLVSQASAASLRHGAKGPKAPLRAVNLFPTCHTADVVLRWVLHALWSAPKQLHALMASSRTKQGKYVDPEVILPLTKLALYSTQQLCHAADEEPLAKRLLQAMGVGSRININFLQAIKDVDLHQALLELKSRLPRETRDED